jgi:uncharacterized protein (DUF1697 family)/uncharacterized protein YndB with AHSA1/START domain
LSRWIAFLRAINVGGHTVMMDRLRKLFESLGFSSVETYIASGNIVFETPDSDSGTLENRIEQSLKEALGYEVATFIRTPAELSAITRYTPFNQADLDNAVALNVAFIAAALDGEAHRRLVALSTDIDEFNVHSREIYWLCRKKQSESTFSNAVLEKTIGQPSTLRGINTLRKLVAKYALMDKNYVSHASITIDVPAAKVWEAVTKPELIKQYLYGTEVTTDWQVGNPITYKGVWQGKPYEDKGKVLQVELGKLLVSTFWSSLSGDPDIPENYKTVRYELSPVGKGTKLTITQDNNATQEEASHSEQNWNMVLEGIKQLLE